MLKLYKTLLLIVFYAASPFFGQTQDVSILFEKLETITTPKIQSLFKKAEVWEYTLTENKFGFQGNLMLRFPTRNINFAVDINREVSEKDFQISVDGIPYKKSLLLLHYNSINNNSVPSCRISVSENFILGSFRIDGNEYIIEQASNYDSSYQSNKIIIYNTADVVAKNYLCNLTDDIFSFRGEAADIEDASATQRTCRVIDYAIAVDYAVYLSRGSNIVQTSNYILGVMNLVEGNYVGVFNDDLNFKITELLIFTNSNINPWPVTRDVNTNLNNFRTASLAMFSKPFDLASYWMGQTSTNTVGLAWVGTTCDLEGYNTNIISNFSGASTDVLRCIVAHEVGHNFGCRHTASGFIMGPTVSTATTWAPESINVFNARLANSSQSRCITPCQYTACERLAVSNIRINDNGGQFSINWNASPNPIRIEYRKSQTGPFILLGSYGSGTTSASLTYSTPCETKEFYQIKITAICPNNQEGISTTITTQSRDVIPTANVSIAPTKTSICFGKIVSFVATTNVPTPFYLWRLNGVIVGDNSAQYSSSTLRNGDQIECVVNGQVCNTTLSASSNIVTMLVDMPPSPFIVRGNNILYTSGNSIGSSYQWNLNDQLLPGEISNKLVLQNFGNYKLTETLGNCTATSNVISILPFTDQRISIYPNPVNDIVIIQTGNIDEYISAARLYDVTGKLVLAKEIPNHNVIRLEVQRLQKALYIVELITNKRKISSRLLKH